VPYLSDPRDDGYFRGDTYPKGGWRSPDGGVNGEASRYADFILATR